MGPQCSWHCRITLGYGSIFFANHWGWCVIPNASVLILGAGDVGSAVAHRLHGHGARVLLCDLPQPSHSRRGMAYTDALFDGESTLEGVRARHVPSLQAAQVLWRDGAAIPVVALPEQALAREMAFDVVIDAVMRRQLPAADRRALAALSIGLGPGFTPGINCHVAIETQWGESLGRVLRDRGAAELAGGPQLLDGKGRERFVSSRERGLWRTRAAIGHRVAAGDVVGFLDDAPVHAPMRGSLRGLTRDGAVVGRGQKIVEVDPRDTPQVFGLGPRPLAIAHGVCVALGLEPANELHHPSPPA
jgi:xanthine dehydrogenase accessory factor